MGSKTTNFYRLYDDATKQYFDTIESSYLPAKFKYKGMKLAVVHSISCHNRVHKIFVVDVQRRQA